ncbi:unnamed protein product [Calypogeia fissa]
MAVCSAIAVAVFSVLLISVSAGFVDARVPDFSSASGSRSGSGIQSHSRRLSSLVVNNQLIVPYHRGPILSGDESTHSIAIYLVWYGTFSESQRAPIVDFFGSFGRQEDETLPSVSSWWKTIQSYKDIHGETVMSQVQLAGQTADDYSKGKSLKESDLEDLVEKSLSKFPADSKSVYFVLTAEDVQVESFCMNSCGSHYSSAPTTVTKHQRLPYAWVGNAASQCAGRCAWPYAKPMYGPRNFVPLVAPNGDVGVDGMVINIATLLAGIATNPHSNAYFQGDALAPLEAATACAGQYGAGAFPGYPGMLLKDESTGASYNAVGSNGRKYLLPAVWDPTTLACKNTFVPQVDVSGFGLQDGFHSAV